MTSKGQYIKSRVGIFPRHDDRWTLWSQNILLVAYARRICDGFFFTIYSSLWHGRKNDALHSQRGSFLRPTKRERKPLRKMRCLIDSWASLKCKKINHQTKDTCQKKSQVLCCCSSYRIHFMGPATRPIY